jgi:hypothetical protein
MLPVAIRYYLDREQASNRERKASDVTPVDGDHEAPDPIQTLADRIADRLAARLDARLTELARSAGDDRQDALWSAQRVASHYGVRVDFVYQHADELGCVRLGGGPCPRIRFDPDAVQARWSRVGSAMPAEMTPKRRRPPTRRSTTPQANTQDLLEFDREP